MRPEQIELIPAVGAPAVAPDGTRVVVSVGHPDLGADAVVAQLWEVAFDGGVPTRRRLTRGFRDTAPRFSPDGTRLAFLRAGADGPAQLALVDARGGEPMLVTDLPLGVTGYAWSPDGARIVLSGRDAEPGRYGTVDGLGAAAEPPRRFTTLRYRANGIGYTPDRPMRLWLLDVPSTDDEPGYRSAPSSAEAAQPAPLPPLVRLTGGDVDHVAPRFSADGSAVLFIAALHDGRDRDLRSQVWWVPVPADAAAPLAEPVAVTPVEASIAVSAFEVGADGRVWLLANELGETGTDFIGRGTSVLLLDADGLYGLTDPAEVDFGDPGVGISLVDADTVLSIRRVRGRSELVAVDANGAVETVHGGEQVTGVGIAGGTLAIVRDTATSVGDLVVLRGGVELPTVSFSDALTATAPRVPRELEVPTRDGGSVHGWIVLPDGPGPHPVLLNIHGGPFAQYTSGFFDEFQVYADAGYAVVYGNPRGAAGYGETAARSIRERMGTVDMTDVLDLLDGALAAEPALDGSRLGIMGGSYGGYLTAWTIAHDHRFRAAIVERGFLDPESFIGTSDIGSFFSQEYTGRDAALRVTQSPQAVVGDVTTPTLVLHSELDLRCPLPQAERYYHDLVVQGVEAELVVFPGENHELSRSGRPRHRVERFEAILDWWRRHLPVRADAARGGAEG